MHIFKKKHRIINLSPCQWMSQPLLSPWRVPHLGMFKGGNFLILSSTTTTPRKVNGSIGKWPPSILGFHLNFPGWNRLKQKETLHFVSCEMFNGGYKRWSFCQVRDSHCHSGMQFFDGPAPFHGKKHNAKNTEVMFFLNQPKQWRFLKANAANQVRDPPSIFRRHDSAGSAVACCCFKKRSFPVHMGRMTQDDARVFYTLYLQSKAPKITVPFPRKRPQPRNFLEFQKCFKPLFC